MTTISIPPASSFQAITTSTPTQTALVTQILAAAAASPSNTATYDGPPSVFQAPPPVTLAYSYFFTSPNGASGTNITGAAAIPAASLILSFGGDSYTTGGTSVSTVVAADGAPVTIVNNDLDGALIAATGAASGSRGNTLEGLTGASQFITGISGRDAILLLGAANNLTSNGNDVVLVGGPSTIAAAATGTDNVTMTGGASLAFFNTSNSGTIDSVTGGAGSIVVMAGQGSTSVTAGLGREYFFLDTSAGNTTINANNSASAALTFIKDLNTGSANITVNSFAPSGTIAVHGYTSYSIAASTSATGGSVLSFSDGSQVSFNGLSTTALQTAIRTV